MLSSVRRRVLDVKDEAQLIKSVQAADEAYIKAVRRLQGVGKRP